MKPSTHLAAALALAPALIAGAQQTHAAAAPTGDATWAKLYATSCGPAPRKCAPSTNGYENQFMWDERLPALLRTSFPQHQWFWRDHGQFVNMPDLVRQFIGVPGDLLVDQDRYVTANGCVPHVGNERGMLWIDTGTQPATLIFVATDLVTDVAGSDATHLWLFSSKRLDFENLPPAFLTSLARWRDDNIARGYKQDFVLATLIRPDGYQLDLTYPTLFYKKNGPGAKQ